MRAPLAMMLLIVACSHDKQDPPRWALAVISKRAAPCAPSDPPCEMTWKAQSYGELTTTATPNGNDYSSPDRVKPSTITDARISRADFETLTELLSSPEFHAGMTDGFPCQGPTGDPQMTLQFVFVDPTDAVTSQPVDGCTRGPYGAVTLPSRILQLLGIHTSE